MGANEVALGLMISPRSIGKDQKRKIQSQLVDPIRGKFGRQIP